MRRLEAGSRGSVSAMYSSRLLRPSLSLSAVAMAFVAPPK
jgi:hypothetical protein